MIKPTVGRVVLVFFEEEQLQPFSGSVAYVHSDRLINAGYLDATGWPHQAERIPLLQDDDAKPVTGPWAEWMPYQKGQAAKTEAVEAQLTAAGHRCEEIAKVAHEVNRAYCQALGDNSQAEWCNAPEWQRQSALAGVAFHMANPNAGPEASHESWLNEKERDGWRWGAIKDAEKKQHPCYLPYDQLPVEQRAKDYIFRAVVHALK